MNKETKLDESLDYRGFHVDFYLDEHGQQVYTIFNGKEISFGAFNSNYINDMKYVIDNHLDLITTFNNLQAKGVYGGSLWWFDNSGYDDIKLEYRGRIIAIYTLGDRALFTGPQKEIILHDAEFRLANAKEEKANE